MGLELGPTKLVAPNFLPVWAPFAEPKSSDLPNPNVASVSAFGPSTKGTAHKNGAAGRGRTACSEEPKEAAGRA